MFSNKAPAQTDGQENVGLSCGGPFAKRRQNHRPIPVTAGIWEAEQSVCACDSAHSAKLSNGFVCCFSVLCQKCRAVSVGSLFSLCNIQTQIYTIVIFSIALFSYLSPSFVKKRYLGVHAALPIAATRIVVEQITALPCQNKSFLLQFCSLSLF